MNDTMSSDPKALKEARILGTTKQPPIVDYNPRAIFDREWSLAASGLRIGETTWNQDCWDHLQNCRPDELDTFEVVCALTESEYGMMCRSYIHAYIYAQYMVLASEAKKYADASQELCKLDVNRRVNRDSSICLAFDFTKCCLRKHCDKDAKSTDDGEMSEGLRAIMDLLGNMGAQVGVVKLPKK